MLNDLLSGSFWSIMTIIGPILLAAALIYGIMASRRRRRTAEVAGDDSTRRLYTGRADGTPPGV